MATVGQAIEFGGIYWYLHWIYIDFYWYLLSVGKSGCFQLGKPWLFPNIWRELKFAGGELCLQMWLSQLPKSIMLECPLCVIMLILDYW